MRNLTHRLSGVPSSPLLNPVDTVYDNVLAADEILEAISRAIGMEGDPPTRERLPGISHWAFAQDVPDALNDNNCFLDDFLKRVLNRLPTGSGAIAHVVSRFSC